MWLLFFNRIPTLWHQMCSSHRIPEAARCSPAERNTAAGCTESYLSDMSGTDCEFYWHGLMGWNKLCTCLKRQFKNLKGICPYLLHSNAAKFTIGRLLIWVFSMTCTGTHATITSLKQYRILLSSTPCCFCFWNPSTKWVSIDTLIVRLWQ